MFIPTQNIVKKHNLVWYDAVFLMGTKEVSPIRILDIANYVMIS